MEFCSRHEEKPHLCDICSKAFTTIDALGKHKETEHTSEHLFHLFVCSSLAEGSNENLKMQRSTHISMETMQIEPPSATVNTDKPYLPNLCHEPFKDSENVEFYAKEQKLSDMLNVKDTVTNMYEIDVKPNLWDICHNAFTNPDNLLQHKETHTYCKDHVKGPSSTMQNPNRWPRQSKYFPSKSLLAQKFIPYCTAEPRDCDQCGKCFLHKTPLTECLRVHGGENVCQCDQCDKTFMEKNDLTQHLGVEKPHQCHLCHKTFAGENFLIAHLTWHNPEKFCFCNLRDKAFALKFELAQHLRTHSTHEHYQCYQCGKIFANNTDFTNHLMTHSREKPFQCVQCGNIL